MINARAQTLIIQYTRSFLSFRGSADAVPPPWPSRRRRGFKRTSLSPCDTSHERLVATAAAAAAATDHRHRRRRRRQYQLQVCVWTEYYFTIIIIHSFLSIRFFFINTYLYIYIYIFIIRTYIIRTQKLRTYCIQNITYLGLTRSHTHANVSRTHVRKLRGAAFVVVRSGVVVTEHRAGPPIFPTFQTPNVVAVIIDAIGRRTRRGHEGRLTPFAHTAPAFTTVCTYLYLSAATVYTFTHCPRRTVTPRYTASITHHRHHGRVF